MKTPISLILAPRIIAGILALNLLQPLARGDVPPGAPTPPAGQSAAEIAHGLHYQTGKITLKNGLADLDISEDFRYLDAADARTVLVKIWGNPPAVAENVLGMILPAEYTPDEAAGWGVTITYLEDGYIKDDDADKLDYDDMLKKLKQQMADQNPERIKEGYQSLDLVGWAAPPRYDRQAKKLYWAKELKAGGADEHTLNYDIRILGRRGVLVLQAIGGMSQMGEISNAAPKILSMVNFNQGHRYIDFDAKTDKVAMYGVGGLIVGGLLLKAGLFKGLWIALLAAKKLIIIGIAAIAGLFQKIFGRGTKVATGPQSLPPPSGPNPV